MAECCWLNLWSRDIAVAAVVSPLEKGWSLWWTADGWATWLTHVVLARDWRVLMLRGLSKSRGNAPFVRQLLMRTKEKFHLKQSTRKTIFYLLLR